MDLATLTLFQAALAGDADAVREAVAAGAALDACDALGLTPLGHAVRGGRTTAVTALVEAGAAPDEGRPSAVAIATEAGDPEMLALLGRGASAGAPPSGAEDLLRAVAASDVALVEQLLARGASPDAAAEGGESALLVAARRDDAPMVACLLAAGASPAPADEDGTDPLMAAAMLGNVDVARLLLDAGADPGVRDRAGRSAADLAAAEGEDAIQALLGPGDPQAPEPSVRSPLVAHGDTDRILAELPTERNAVHQGRFGPYLAIPPSAVVVAHRRAPRDHRRVLPELVTAEVEELGFVTVGDLAAPHLDVVLRVLAGAETMVVVTAWGARAVAGAHQSVDFLSRLADGSLLATSDSRRGAPSAGTRCYPGARPASLLSKHRARMARAAARGGTFLWAGHDLATAASWIDEGLARGFWCLARAGRGRC